LLISSAGKGGTVNAEVRRGKEAAKKAKEEKRANAATQEAALAKAKATEEARSVKAVKGRAVSLAVLQQRCPAGVAMATGASADRVNGYKLSRLGL
jgi:hypothetical protein